MQEHYLVIMEKREESKVFDGVWICLGEKLKRGERESAYIYIYIYIGKIRGLGVFIGHFLLFIFRRPYHRQRPNKGR